MIPSFVLLKKPKTGQKKPKKAKKSQKKKTKKNGRLQGDGSSKCFCAMFVCSIGFNKVDVWSLELYNPTTVREQPLFLIMPNWLRLMYGDL
jgi:hypothetical protein